MTRPWLRITLLSFCAASLLATMLLSTTKASLPSSIDTRIEHVVDIRESGLLVINDTVTLSTAPNDNTEPVQTYTLGFPFNYHSDLAYAFAYDSSNRSLELGLNLNAGLGKVGFYGVQVNFPSAIDVSNGGSYKFTIVFVFSDSISFSILPGDVPVFFYNASFPAYPSLLHVASEVNVRISIPEVFSYNQSSYEKEGLSLTQTVEGSRRLFSYTKSNLSAFSDHPAWCYIFKTGGAAQFLDFEEFKRRIEILDTEEIAITDSYKVLNKAGGLGQIQLKLPKEAQAVSAYDEFGLVQEGKLKTQQSGEYTNATITFTVPYEQEDEIYVSFGYKLPWKNHVTLVSFGEFHVSVSLFENTDLAIRKSAATVVLPEGAVLSSLKRQNLNDLQNTAFSASFTITFENATPFHDSAFRFAYQRPVFWDSFRPTIWMGAFVFVVAALFGARRFYRPSIVAPLPTAVISIRADDLKSFVTNYDQKRRLLKEVESLEAAARKGKIPRRQYKVRKMTVDGRLTSLSRDLVELKDKLRRAGPRYAELMRQLEIAETELKGVEAEIDRAEVRYRRGDLSPQAYHNVLETSYKRRDRAQTTIDGVLLRLREEIT